MDSRKIAKAAAGKKVKNGGPPPPTRKQEEGERKNKKKGKPEPAGEADLIRWGNHTKAWRIAVYQLKHDVWPLQSKGVADDMELFYSHKEFLQFDKDKWIDRLEKCRVVIRKRDVRADRDNKMMERFRQEHPVRATNDFGTVQWRGSGADDQFRKDMESKRYKDFDTWEEFKNSRPIYKDFDMKRFTDHKSAVKMSKKFDYVVKRVAEGKKRDLFGKDHADSAV